MIATTYTSGVLQYIPLFYVIWSDDLLSASEISVVKTHLEEDESLDAADRDLLSQWLNRKSPPSDEEFKKWKQLIAKAHIKLIESDTYPLSSLSERLVKTVDDPHATNSHLQAIELNLGIQPNHYNYLFDIEVEHELQSNRYSAKTIDDFLLGEQAAVLFKFRDFLNQKLFRWETLRDKDVFRQKVLEQVSLLGKSGYGAWGYPEAYGGKDDMLGYAGIFEHLMYVDGSLAVKFGCNTVFLGEVFKN